MRFDHPKFERPLNLDHYLELIQTIERIFVTKGYADEKAFKIVVLWLKKNASLLHENTKRQRATDERSRIKTWAKLKKLMHKKFLIDNYKHDLPLRLSSSNQERMSVEEYIHEFDQFQICSGLEEEE